MKYDQNFNKNFKLVKIDTIIVVLCGFFVLFIDSVMLIGLKYFS